MKVRFAHCMFEQSGIFKNAFRQLDIPSLDYDIQNYYKKPTQYIFVNCAPAGKKSIQLDKPMKYVNHQSTVNRSMISDDYAYNFICDHILGKESGHTMPTLF